MGYEQSSLWRRTLGVCEDEAVVEFVDRLRGSYVQFREAVEPVANDIALSVPGYTDHGIKHCDSLWDTASILVGEDYPLNPIEAFVLGGAFLVHDLGMGLSAYPDGLRGIVNSPEWLDLLSSLHPKDSEMIYQTTLTDIERNPNWDGLTQPPAKEVLTIYLRMHHAEQARKIVSDSWVLGDQSTQFLLGDAKMRSWYGELIGSIARSHWLGVEDLVDNLPSHLGALPGFPTDWTVDAVKIACILRLADAIQIDGRRADPLHTPHRNPQGESLAHWQFQEQFLSAHVTDTGRVIFSSASGFRADKIEAWWIAFDMIRMIDAELRKVDNLAADLGKPRLLAYAVAGAESPQRFARFVAPDGWEPIDTRPHIDSPLRVIDRLGGSALYGENSDSGGISVRELLANALDATRALRLAFPEDDPEPIRVSFSTTDKGDLVTIRDFGIGMTEMDVVNLLCNFGVSGWKGETIRRNFPGIIHNGFDPAGRFGIGFFSVFMAAENVRVTTRHFEAAKAETFILEFPGGIEQRSVFRRASREERFNKPGTEISFTLRHRFLSADGMFSGSTLDTLRNEVYLPNYVGDLAFMADESIYVVPLDSIKSVLAVRRNEWKDASSEAVCDAIHSPNHRTNPSYLRMRERFSQVIQPIHDVNGALIGRVGLDVASSAGGDDYWNAYGQVHCGGLRAALLPDVIGVIGADPASASRDEVVFNIPLDNLCDWYRDQLTRLASLSLNHRALMSVQAFGLMIGELSNELPIAFCNQGYIFPDDFVSEVRKVDSIHYLPLIGDSLNLGDKTYHAMMYDNDVTLLPRDTYLAPRRHYDGMRTMGMRTNEIADDCSQHERLAIGFDPFEWWTENFMNPGGELVRLCARAWGRPLVEVVASLAWLDLDASGDSRLEFQTLRGTTRLLAGVKVSRPSQV